MSFRQVELRSDQDLCWWKNQRMCTRYPRINHLLDGNLSMLWKAQGISLIEKQNAYITDSIWMAAIETVMILPHAWQGNGSCENLNMVQIYHFCWTLCSQKAVRMLRSRELTLGLKQKGLAPKCFSVSLVVGLAKPNMNGLEKKVRLQFYKKTSFQ